MELQRESRFNTAVFFVTYPGCELFLTEFIDSILSQTYQNFDLIVVEDGCQLDWSAKLDYRIQRIQGTGNIAKNRELGLRNAQESGYQYLILCDVDDFFHPTRFEKIVKSLQEFDCVVHDLNIVINNKIVLRKDYFQQNHEIPVTLPSKYLDEKNLCGFSNCGINLKNVNIPTINQELRIVDWYVFSVFLESGLKIGFIPESLTDYRQHEENLIGIENFSMESFKKLLPLKIMHYLHMKKINERYNVLYGKYKDILHASDSEISNAIVKNKTEIQYPLWWENIRL